MLEPNTTMFPTPLLLTAILGLPPLLVPAHSRAQLAKELAALPTPNPNTTGSLLTAVLTCGWRTSTLSPAGTDQARAGRTPYTSTPDNPPTREETLRRTAVHGPRHPETPGGRTKHETRVSKG